MHQNPSIYQQNSHPFIHLDFVLMENLGLFSVSLTAKKQTSPLVSIITPVYNGAEYLDDAVKSVLSQNYKNWELLIIDDGSKDESLQKSNNWATADSRIRVFSHPGNINKGVSATRNLGMSHAKGKYIALLDCDDLWLSNKLECQVNILESDSEILLSYSKVFVIDRDGVPLKDSSKNIEFPHVGGNGIPGKSQVFHEMIADVIWMPCPTVIFRREVIEKIGGFYENLKYGGEDTIFFTAISHLGYIYFYDAYTAKYRMHENNFTMNNPYWQLFIFEVYEVINKTLPQRHLELKELCEKKIGELSILYCSCPSRRDFIINKASSFFSKAELHFLFGSSSY